MASLFKRSSPGNTLASSPTPPPTSVPRSTTPRPSSDAPSCRAGTLGITLISARGLTLPPGASLPTALTNAAHNRRSLNPWWLPYLVVSFDQNQTLINAKYGELSAPRWEHDVRFDVAAARASGVQISAYLRASEESVGAMDVLLARIDFNPVFDPSARTDSWMPSTAGSGQFHLKISFHPETPSLSIDSFDLLKVIGKGSFGKVMQVRKKDTQRVYALKTIRKKNLANRPGEITHILAERTVLALVNNPFVVPLKFSFQTPDKLYLVMPFINGGELFYHLQREGRFDERRSRYYASELLCALEHLHSFDVVYRDLKPENILLDYTGHIALCDFGLCKLNMTDSNRTNTFCGTPEYIAPELLEQRGYGKTVDWWTLGVLLYEMLTGLPPFYDENVNTMYQKILRAPLTFTPDMSSHARTLITALLVRDPARRLGANGATEIKNHAFFAPVDWRRLLRKEITPPFRPSVTSPLDVANFDVEFTNEAPQDSVVEDSALISETVQDQFRGFTYNPQSALGESVANGGGF